MNTGIHINGLAGCAVGSLNTYLWADWQEDRCDLENFSSYAPNLNIKSLVVLSGRLWNCHSTIVYTITGLAVAPIPKNGLAACTASGLDWVCTCTSITYGSSPCSYIIERAGGYSGAGVS